MCTRVVPFVNESFVRTNTSRAWKEIMFFNQNGIYIYIYLYIWYYYCRVDTERSTRQTRACLCAPRHDCRWNNSSAATDRIAGESHTGVGEKRYRSIPRFDSHGYMSTIQFYIILRLSFLNGLIFIYIIFITWRHKRIHDTCICFIVIFFFFVWIPNVIFYSITEFYVKFTLYRVIFFFSNINPVFIICVWYI